MPLAEFGRMQFYVFETERLITIRVIGDMSGPDFIRKLFEHLDTVQAPWTYNRIMDFRRFTALLLADDIEAMGKAWTERIPTDVPRTKLAIVSKDAVDKGTQPTISPTAPSRVVRHFCRYHDALSWVLSDHFPQATDEPSPWGVGGGEQEDLYLD